MSTIDSLNDALFSGTQQKLFGLLYGRPERSFYLRELIDAAAMGRGSVQRELEKMASAGLVTVNKIGKQKHFQANPDCPIYLELASIFSKGKPAERNKYSRSRAAVGDKRGEYRFVPKLQISRRALENICRRFHIRKLSLFGSGARGELQPDSDVDVLVEFEPGNSPALGRFSELQEQLSILFDGRDVDVATPAILNNPHRKRAIMQDLETLYAG